MVDCKVENPEMCRPAANQLGSRHLQIIFKVRVSTDNNRRIFLAFDESLPSSVNCLIHLIDAIIINDTHDYAVNLSPSISSSLETKTSPETECSIIFSQSSY